ncbi:unnamed protein product [Linum tenue]|uniref:Uncharacterized protein n=1 Tax=Linum tenue TaxID=586396 RepID=A0AAV0IQA7_9ROSI|nr:unnamed protein product [Linum tenue]
MKWNFDLSCKTQEILPGLATLFRFALPDPSKVELRFTYDYVGLTAGVGVKASEHGPFSGNSYNPILSFSGLLGTNLFTMGAYISMSLSLPIFVLHSSGLSVTKKAMNCHFTRDDKLDTVRASFYHSFIDTTRIAIATVEFRDRIILVVKPAKGSLASRACIYTVRQLTLCTSV